MDFMKVQEGPLAHRRLSTVPALLAALVLAGCASVDSGPHDGAGAASPAAADPAGAGGSAGVGGTASVGGSVVASGGQGASAAVAGGPNGEGDTACPETRPLLRPLGTLVELTFAPSLAGKPLVLGELNPMPGGQVSPLNVRFYVSEFSLLAADGTPTAVDLVSSATQVEPYGVHLVNLEDPESLRVRVLAAAGSYTGARFTLGMNDACNGGGVDRNPPLSANSQMSWPHLAGFLFLRYEAQWTAGAGVAAPAPPPLIHMGGLVGSIFAPQATVAGAFTVPASGSLSRSIQVSFDDILSGASSSGDVSDLPLPLQTPEVIAGEHLRRAVPRLPIFKLVEP